MTGQPATAAGDGSDAGEPDDGERAGDSAFSLASARQAAAEDRLAEWVYDFLDSPGSDNGALAAALAVAGAVFAGPIRLPLDRLTPMAGPDEDHVVVPVAPERWEPAVEAMTKSLDRGWDPPPLLVSHHDGAYFLEDGNHRHEMLRRRGATEAWAVILTFPDDAARARFLLEQGAADGSPPSTARA